MKPSHEQVESFRSYFMNLIMEYTEDFIGFIIAPAEFETKPDFEKEGFVLRYLVMGFLDCLVEHDYIDQGDLKAGMLQARLCSLLKPNIDAKEYQRRKKEYFEVVDDFCDYLESK